jgi:hypothetical protein
VESNEELNCDNVNALALNDVATEELKLLKLLANEALTEALKYASDADID